MAAVRHPEVGAERAVLAQHQKHQLGPALRELSHRDGGDLLAVGAAGAAREGAGGDRERALADHQQRPGRVVEPEPAADQVVAVELPAGRERDALPLRRAPVAGDQPEPDLCPLVARGGHVEVRPPLGAADPAAVRGDGDQLVPVSGRLRDGRRRSLPGPAPAEPVRAGPDQTLVAHDDPLALGTNRGERQARRIDQVGPQRPVPALRHKTWDWEQWIAVVEAVRHR